MLWHIHARWYNVCNSFENSIRFFINCLLSIPWEPEIIFHVESQYETRAPKGCYYILVKLSPYLFNDETQFINRVNCSSLMCFCTLAWQLIFSCEAIGKQLAAKPIRFSVEKATTFSPWRIFRRSFCKQFFQCQHFLVERKVSLSE